MAEIDLNKSAEDFIEQYARRMLHDFAPDALQAMRTALAKKKLDSSSELYNKVRYNIINSTARSMAAIGVSFPDYGRVRDMKRVDFSRPLSKEVIESNILPWVEKKGLSKFKFVPGYANKAEIPSESVALRRIAWGIGKGIHRKKWKTKAWYNRVLWSKINELTEEITLAYNNYHREQLKKALPDKI